MKFFNFGALALFTSLASALYFDVDTSVDISGGDVSISLEVYLSGTSPGTFAFVLIQEDVFVQLLKDVTIDVDVGVQVDLELPKLSGSGYSIRCTPPGQYETIYAEVDINVEVST